MYVNEHNDKSENSKERHEHEWSVVSDHWQCEICGKVFGLVN
jgi:hypothetical protein